MPSPSLAALDVSEEWSIAASGSLVKADPVVEAEKVQGFQLPQQLGLTPGVHLHVNLIESSASGPCMLTRESPILLSTGDLS